MLDTDTTAAYIDTLTRGDTIEAERLGTLLDVVTKLEQAARDTASPSLHAAALDYAARGIAVFPLQARGKTPATSRGFKDATTDIAKIIAWWQAMPEANIGVPTGLTFDVVDIDGAEGIASMYNGTTPLVDELTVIGVATTSRDGGRHIYVPARGEGNKAGIFPGVDYRGRGGYVVAPPSIGANGRRYTWTQQLTDAQVAAA